MHADLVELSPVDGAGPDETPEFIDEVAEPAPRSGRTRSEAGGEPL